MQQNDHGLLATLVLVFAPLSLSAFGGGISVISAIQHQVVDVYHWATGPEFLALFAISRAAPGPGSMMLTTLIGLKVAGIPGAVVATLAMFVPSSALCVGCAALLSKYRGRRFIVMLEAALLPIGAGLLVAGVAGLAQLVSVSWGLLSIAVGSVVACLIFRGLNPLVVIFAGAITNFAISALF